jgi:putative redox protein
MAYVTVINEHQHVQQIVSGHHHLTADEPVAAGGSDAGLAPRELLLASLGADTAVALRRHAMQNDWSLGKITVGLRWSRDAEGREHIERRMSFGRPLSSEQKEIILEVAANTPVTSVLRAGIAIQSALMDLLHTSDPVRVLW